jgi:hypothetical protein
MAGFNPTYAGSGDNKRDVYGATEVGVWTITFGASDTYVTGGLALTAATFGLSRPILGLEVIGANTAASVYAYQWNSQTSKLMMLGTGGSTAGTAAYADASSGASMASFAITVRVTTQR